MFGRKKESGNLSFRARLSGLGILIAIAVSALPSSASALTPDSTKDVKKLQKISAEISAAQQKGDEVSKKKLAEVERLFAGLDDHFRKDIKTYAAKGSSPKGTKFRTIVQKDMAFYSALMKVVMGRVSGLKAKKEVMEEYENFKKLMLEEQNNLNLQTAEVEEFHHELREARGLVATYGPSHIKEVGAKLATAEEAASKSDLLNNPIHWQTYEMTLVTMTSDLLVFATQHYATYHDLEDYWDSREAIEEMMEDRFSHDKKARSRLLQKIKTSVFNNADQEVLKEGLKHIKISIEHNPRIDNSAEVAKDIEELFEKIPGGEKVEEAFGNMAYQLFANHLVADSANTDHYSVPELDKAFDKIEKSFGEHKNLALKYYAACLTNVLSHRAKDFAYYGFSPKHFESFWKSISHALDSEYLSDVAVKGIYGLMTRISNEIGGYVSKNPEAASDLKPIVSKILDKMNDISSKHKVR